MFVHIWCFTQQNSPILKPYKVTLFLKEQCLKYNHINKYENGYFGMAQ